MRALALAAVVAALAARGASSQSHDLLTFVIRNDVIDAIEVRTGICTMATDGSRQILMHESSGDDTNPSWTSDGSMLAFENYDPQDSREFVLIMRADGTFIGHVPPLGRHPSWSPDGRSIVYTYNANLVVRDVQTWTRRQITRSRQDTSPAWSPSGTEIAFSRARVGGRRDLYVVHPDGTGLRRLTHDTSDNAEPSWSPDGSRLVYVRNGRLYVIRSDGRAPRPLSRTPILGHSPAWSPDGDLIAFVDAHGISTVRPDGTGRHASFPRGSAPTWRTGAAPPLDSSQFDGVCSV